MSRLILVCGPTGAGKTTYAITLSAEIGAVRFSIDPWMVTLFSKDMTTLDYSWMIERVQRCYEQIWDVAGQILAIGGNVVLDLGFTEKTQRALFVDWASELDAISEVHFLDAPKEVRQQRVEQRNRDKDPSVYAFDVTDMMFNFMESRFEAPDEKELRNGCSVET